MVSSYERLGRFPGMGGKGETAVCVCVRVCVHVCVREREGIETESYANC